MSASLLASSDIRPPTSLPLCDEYIAMRDLPGRAPSRPSVQTAWRWLLQGLKLADGSIVRLASVKCGGRRFVTATSLAEFLAATNSTTTRMLNAQARRPPQDKSQHRGQVAGQILGSMGY